MRGLGWGPLSSSSCRNGSRGALGLGLLQWLSHNNGLVPSAIEGWASLRFPFLFRYWRQIWPVLVLARRSQVPSRWHRDGGKCGRSPIQTFPRHLDQTGGNMRRDSVVVFVGGGAPTSRGAPFPLTARDEASFLWLVGKEFWAFSSHLKRRRSPQERREVRHRGATIARVPQMCQSIPEEPVFPALPRLSRRG